MTPADAIREFRSRLRAQRLRGESAAGAESLVRARMPALAEAFDSAIAPRAEAAIDLPVADPLPSVEATTPAPVKRSRTKAPGKASKDGKPKRRARIAVIEGQAR